MRPLLIVTLAAALTAPALAMRPTQSAGPSRAAAEEPQPMPALRLTDFDGKPVDYNKYKGSIVVVDFWATWCGPCLAEIPHYNKLQEKFAGKGVTVLGVTLTSGDAKEVREFIEKNKAKNPMKYPVFMGDDEQSNEFNLIGFPTTFLVTRDWKIHKRYLGASPNKSQQLEAEIQKLLELDARQSAQ